DREEVEQRVVLEQHADAPAQPAELGFAAMAIGSGHGFAEHVDRAAVRRLEAADELADHALSRRGRSAHAEALAAREVERDAGEPGVEVIRLPDARDPDSGNRLLGHLHSSLPRAMYFDSGWSTASRASSAHAPA